MDRRSFITSALSAPLVVTAPGILMPVREWLPWRKHFLGPCPVEEGDYLRIEVFDRITRQHRLREGLVTADHVTHPEWETDGSGYWARITRFQTRIAS